MPNPFDPTAHEEEREQNWRSLVTERIELSPVDFDHLVRVLNDPPRPNARLRQLMAEVSLLDEAEARREALWAELIFGTRCEEPCMIGVDVDCGHVVLSKEGATLYLNTDQAEVQAKDMGEC